MEEKKARRQVKAYDVAPNGKKVVKSSNMLEEYNIWYHKSANFEMSTVEPRTTKCDPMKDSGITKGSSSPKNYICVAFANGCCPHGYDCKFLHRLPLPTDHQDESHDCFGRERFGSDRRDMGGVGTFNRQNRTLYIGGVPSHDKTIEDFIKDRYSPFGEIEATKVLKTKPVAFVKYKYRQNAEFAKEATQNLLWETGEVYNVRWATEDPNPRAKADFVKEAEQKMIEALKKKVGEEMMGQYFDMAKREVEEEEESAASKRQKIVDFYPSTDDQYYYSNHNNHHQPHNLEASKFGFTSEEYERQEQEKKDQEAYQQWYQYWSYQQSLNSHNQDYSGESTQPSQPGQPGQPGQNKIDDYYQWQIYQSQIYQNYISNPIYSTNDNYNDNDNDNDNGNTLVVGSSSDSKEKNQMADLLGDYNDEDDNHNHHEDKIHENKADEKKNTET